MRHHKTITIMSSIVDFLFLFSQVKRFLHQKQGSNFPDNLLGLLITRFKGNQDATLDNSNNQEPKLKKPLPERVDNRSVSTDLAVGARGDSRRRGRFPHTYLHVIIRCAVEPKYSHAHYRHNVCMTTMIQSMWRSCQVIICLCANKHKVLPVPPAGDRPWIHQSGADETDIS